MNRQSFVQQKLFFQIKVLVALIYFHEFCLKILIVFVLGDTVLMCTYFHELKTYNNMGKHSMGLKLSSEWRNFSSFLINHHYSMDLFTSAFRPFFLFFCIHSFNNNYHYHHFSGSPSTILLFSFSFIYLLSSPALHVPISINY